MVDCKPETIIDKLRQTVNTGKYGINYTICRRDKNNLLRERYWVDDYKIKAILLGLTENDYISSEPSDNKDYPDDTVHVFITEVQLLRKFSTNTNYVNVRLYIKFTWSNSLNQKMLIISFHEESDI